MKKRARAPLKTKNVGWSIAACAFICLSGIGYVWAKSQLNALGREMKALETKLEDLKRRNSNAVQKYAEMCNPRELEAAVRKANLGLIAPRPDQIVRLPEPPVTGAEIKTYAANAAGEP